MDIVEQALSRHGLTYKQLNSEEKKTIELWSQSIKTNTLTTDRIREYVSTMKNSVAQELLEKNESPQSWLSLLSFLIPIIGIIRKWYIDQRQVELKARLTNYSLLEVLLSSPDKAAKDLDRALAAFASTIT